MTWRISLGILALIQSVPIHALWTPAPSTTPSPEPSPPPSPTTTSPPSNTSHLPAQLCGYVDYNSLNSYTCGSSHTCFWNSALRLVGCGHATSINYITSCIPHRARAACTANPSIICCDAAHPHCVTPRMGPRGNYSILACEATRPVPYRVHLTYRGQNTTGYLPRWLGEDGSVSYGTRMPRNGSKSMSGTETETSGLVGFDVVVETTVRPGAASSGQGDRGEGGDGEKEGNGNRIFIIPIILGAGLLIAAIAIFVILVLIYRQRKQMCRKEVELRDMGPERVLGNM